MGVVRSRRNPYLCAVGFRSAQFGGESRLSLAESRQEIAFQRREMVFRPKQKVIKAGPSFVSHSQLESGAKTPLVAAPIDHALRNGCRRPNAMRRLSSTALIELRSSGEQRPRRNDRLRPVVSAITRKPELHISTIREQTGDGVKSIFTPATPLSPLCLS